MKQTTKIILPLGLFMSVVIPVTVKSLFTDTDLFESKEDYRMDYLQPYKPRPEIATELPGNTELMQIEGIAPPRPKPRERAKSYSERIENLDNASEAALEAEIGLFGSSN